MLSFIEQFSTLPDDWLSPGDIWLQQIYLITKDCDTPEGLSPNQTAAWLRTLSNELEDRCILFNRRKDASIVTVKEALSQTMYSVRLHAKIKQLGEFQDAEIPRYDHAKTLLFSLYQIVPQARELSLKLDPNAGNIIPLTRELAFKFLANLSAYKDERKRVLASLKNRIARGVSRSDPITMATYKMLSMLSLLPCDDYPAVALAGEMPGGFTTAFRRMDNETRLVASSYSGGDLQDQFGVRGHQRVEWLDVDGDITDPTLAQSYLDQWCVFSLCVSDASISPDDPLSHHENWRLTLGGIDWFLAIYRAQFSAHLKPPDGLIKVFLSATSACEEKLKLLIADLATEYISLSVIRAPTCPIFSNEYYLLLEYDRDALKTESTSLSNAISVVARANLQRLELIPLFFTDPRNVTTFSHGYFTKVRDEVLPRL
jgi:hypothetical protein